VVGRVGVEPTTY